MTIPIKKVSPSSIKTFEGCQMKWFLSYILGYREPTGKAAALGTMGHYVLECVARAKKLRDEGKKWQNDKIVGRIKSDYNIFDFIEKSFEHFTKKERHIEWSGADKNTLYDYIDKARNHEFFPENHKRIISTEQFFNIPIKEDWAKYAYLKGDKVEEGYLHINGIIDIVFEDNNGDINYLDYKFGRTQDWNTGVEHTYATLSEDIQLALYYWALLQKFSLDNINTHIWYVNKDKPFSLFFDDSHIKKALAHVKDIYLQIKSMSNPKRTITWKCNNFCPFSKTSFSDWGKQGVDVKADDYDQFKPVDGCKSVCDATHYFLNKRPIEMVVENCKNGK